MQGKEPYPVTVEHREVHSPAALELKKCRDCSGVLCPKGAPSPSPGLAYPPTLGQGIYAFLPQRGCVGY